MTPVDIDEYADAAVDKDYVRRVPPSCVAKNVDTGELELVPQKAFVFNPDLSVHQVQIIEALGSTVPKEYVMPPNGAMQLPLKPLREHGVHLKATPHAEEPILGPAHHSVFGPTLTPSKTDKAAMRDILMSEPVWLGKPQMV